MPIIDGFEFIFSCLSLLQEKTTAEFSAPDSGYYHICWTTKSVDLRLTVIFDGFEQIRKHFSGTLSDRLQYTTTKNCTFHRSLY